MENTGQIHPSVIHQDIDTAVEFDTTLGKRLHLGAIANISGNSYSLTLSLENLFHRSINS